MQSFIRIIVIKLQIKTINVWLIWFSSLSDHYSYITADHYISPYHIISLYHYIVYIHHISCCNLYDSIVQVHLRYNHHQNNYFPSKMTLTSLSLLCWSSPTCNTPLSYLRCRLLFINLLHLIFVYFVIFCIEDSRYGLGLVGQ